MSDDLVEFLQHALRLESDAAAGYQRLAAVMRDRGEPELAELFDRFGRFSVLHLAETRERLEAALAGRPAPELTFRWPDGTSPEDPLAAMDQPGLDIPGALKMALTLERQACDFYATIAGQTRSEQVQELAQQFAEEESEHVSHLERCLARGST